MSEEIKVTTQGQEVPASPPDANTPPQTPPEDTAPGAKGPESVAGFHDVIRHPEFQPYLQRQIEEQVAARTAAILSKVSPISQTTLEVKEDQTDVKHLMENFEVDEKRAKELVKWRDRGIDKKTEALTQRFDVLDLSLRFGQVFQQNADAKQYEGKMLDIFNNMNEQEKAFVMHSIDGATYLYDVAKKRSGVLPTTDRYRGTSPAARSTPPAQKVGERDVQMTQALIALKNGNRTEYERIMAQVR